MQFHCNSIAFAWRRRKFVAILLQFYCNLLQQNPEDGQIRAPWRTVVARGAPGVAAKKKTTVAHFYYNMLDRLKLRIHLWDEGAVSFTYVTGGAGSAAGNVGVPVLRGLGGGSATGVPFQSLVWFGRRAVETSRSDPLELCYVFVFFPGVVVQFFAKSQKLRPKAP